MTLQDRASRSWLKSATALLVPAALIGLACAGSGETTSASSSGSSPTSSGAGGSGSSSGTNSGTTSGTAGLSSGKTVTAGTVRVDILDVGQGDGILIRTPAKNILIDASEGGAKVATQLQQIGITSLDLVVATHPHADHIGGMDDVVAAIPIKLYIDNGLPHTTKTYTDLMADILAKAIPYRAAVNGTVFNLDMGAKFEVLFPNGTPLTGTRSDLNSNSVVTRLSYGSTCFLFVGDSEEPTEHALVSAGLGHCDVLKVAHHGSDHSSTPEFLAAVSPKYALISVGTGNRYGHPGPETLARLQGTGAAIYRTDLLGPITATSDGKQVTIQSGILGVSPKTVGATSISSTEATDMVSASTTNSTSGTSSATSSTTTNTAGNCPYYASSSSSEVFHEASCGQGQRSDPAKRICYTSRDAAVAAGKRPAGCCDP